jgi:hypothetical protein
MSGIISSKTIGISIIIIIVSGILGGIISGSISIGIIIIPIDYYLIPIDSH